MKITRCNQRGHNCPNGFKSIGAASRGLLVKTARKADVAIKPDRADKDCYRLMDGDRIAAFALKLSNGRWAIFDTGMNTRIIKGDTFDTPTAAARRFALP